jgi:hypothetical protein
MKKTVVQLIVTLTAVIVIFSACNTGKSKKLPLINPEFGTYINSFTSGVISVKADIKIKFTQELTLPGMEPGIELDMDLFEFSPKVKGKIILENSRLILFRPEESMKSDTRYDVSLSLYKLFEVPDQLKLFKFGFNTLKQSFEVTRLEFSPYNTRVLQKNKLSGYITTADIIQVKDVMKLLTAKIYLPIDLDGTKGSVILEVAHRNPHSTVFWHIDNDYLSMTTGIHQLEVCPSFGKHNLTVTDERGSSVTREIEILEPDSQK